MCVEQGGSRQPVVSEGSLLLIGCRDAYRTYPRHHRARANVARILGAARALSRTGDGQVPLREVAKIAGVSSAAPYRYFRTCADLNVALAAQELELYFDSMNARLDASHLGRWEDIVHAHATHREFYHSTEAGPALITARFDTDSDEAKQIAAFLVRAIATKFPRVDISPELSFRVELCVRVIDATVHRAFLSEDDRAFILQECRSIIDGYLSS